MSKKPSASKSTRGGTDLVSQKSATIDKIKIPSSRQYLREIVQTMGEITNQVADIEKKLGKIEKNAEYTYGMHNMQLRSVSGRTIASMLNQLYDLVVRR